MIDTGNFETAFVIFGVTFAVLLVAAAAVVVSAVRRDREQGGEIAGTAAAPENRDDRADDRTPEPVG